MTADLSVVPSEFQSRLTLARRETDAVLDRLLPAPSGHQSVIMEAVRYAILGGGKRFRPFLLAECARVFGHDHRSVWAAGAALECIHAYSLVHDDLPCMDDDDLRRGRPTLHKKFDEAIAVLAGDALQTHAFEILAGLEIPAETKCELISGLASASGVSGMIGGQVIDIQADEKSRNEQLITELQRLKTGALIRYAAQAGSILGGAPEKDRLNLCQYAEDLGLIFQITDDILDVEGDAATLGKAVKKDENLGKATFVSILGLVGAKEKAKQLADRAKGRLAPYGEKAQILVETVDYILVRDR